MSLVVITCSMNLEISQKASHMSLLFRNVQGELCALIWTYVNDSITACTAQYKEETTKTEKQFETKPREYDNFQFAGSYFEITKDVYLTHQLNYTNTFSFLKSSASNDEFSSTSSKLSWLTNTQPDICAPVNILAQVTEISFMSMDISTTNKTIRIVRDMPKKGLKMQKVDQKTMHLRVYSVSSFVNNRVTI